MYCGTLHGYVKQSFYFVSSNYNFCFSFSFATCVTMKLTTSLTLNYTIEAETFQTGRKFSRVWFGDSEADKKRLNFVQRPVHMKYDSLKCTDDCEKCETHIVYLKVILV